MKNPLILFLFLLLENSLKAQSSSLKDILELEDLPIGIQEQFLDTSSTSEPQIILDPFYNVQEEVYENINDELKINYFGYDYFDTKTLTFSPILDVPLSDDYKISFGDEFEILINGEINKTYTDKVDLSGFLTVEQIGSIFIEGDSISEATKKINEIVSINYTNTDVVLKITKPAYRRISILGAVKKPGSYLVNPFTSLSEAIRYSEGLDANASLRNISITNASGLKTNHDLYEFLRDGNRSVDPVVKNGDVIFVNRTDKFVLIEGNVFQEMYFEYLENEEIQKLLDLSGLKSYSDLSSIYGKKRVGTSLEYVNLELNDRAIGIEEIYVPKQNSSLFSGLKISGSSVNEKLLDIKESSTLNEVIEKISFSNNVYPFYFEVYDVNDQGLKRSRANYSLSDVASYNLLEISKNSEITFFSREDFEDLQVYAEFKEIDLQKKISAITQLTNNTDNIKKLISDKLLEPTQPRFANPYENMPNSTPTPQEIKKQVEQTQNNKKEYDSVLANFLKDELQRSLSEARILNSEVANLLNYEFKGQSKTKEQLDRLLENSILVNLGSKQYYFPVSGTFSAKFFIDYLDADPSDYLSKPSVVGADLVDNSEGIYKFKKGAVVSFIKNSPKLLTIEVAGAVNSPGTFKIPEGTTLNEIYKIVGMSKQISYEKGIVLSRKNLRDLEKSKLLESKKDLINLVFLNSSNPIRQNSNSFDLTSVINLINTAEDSEYLGRLAGELSPDSQLAKSIIIEDGDKLFIPNYLPFIKVYGEVNLPSAITFENYTDINYYISKSAGFTKFADKDSVYVIKANGTTVLANKKLFQHSDLNLEPGDTIIVPRNISKSSNLPTLSVLTKVFSDIAFSAASLSTLNN